MPAISYALPPATAARRGGARQSVYNVRDYGAAGNGTTDDTAAINSALTAGAGWRVVCPAGTYLISAPLLVPAGTTVEATGATISLAAGSNCNMLRNDAYASAGSASDGAIASGSATLTTALAASAGQTVRVAGAGGAQSMNLVAKVVSVGAGTLTLSVAAGATVTGATVTLYNRDAGIQIIGGTWARGGNGGLGLDQHSIVLRHCDRLTLRDMTHTSSTGKYFVSMGDCTDFLVENMYGTMSSDGIHIDGPASHGTIAHIVMNCGDNLVALTGRNYEAVEDMGGDISNIEIRDIHLLSGAYANYPILSISGVGVTNTAILIDGVYGTSDHTIINFNNDQQDPRTNGGQHNGVIIRNVFARPGAGYQVFWITTSINDLVIDGVRAATDVSHEKVLDVASNGVAPTIARLTLSNWVVTGSGQKGLPVSLQDLTCLVASVNIVNCVCDGIQYLVSSLRNVTVYLTNVQLTNEGGWIQSRGSSGNVRVIAGPCHAQNAVAVVQLGATFSADGDAFNIDASLLTPQAGDRVNNTNSGVGPGTGVVVYDGTIWRRVRDMVTTGAMPSGLWTPADHGLLAWSQDPYIIANHRQPSVATLYLIRLKTPVPLSVTSILLCLDAAGSGLTNCYLGLYTTGGTLVGSTADQSSAWTTAGLYTTALVGGPYAVAAGSFFVGIQVGGGTAPQIKSHGNQGTPFESLANVNVSGATGRTLALATSNAALGNVTMSGTSAQNLNFWVAVS